MFKKIFLYLICFVSILWIGYVGIDIIDKENEFSPIHLFGEKDGKILIINRVNEASFEKIKYTTTPSNTKLISALIPWLKKDHEVIISEKQNHIYIDINENWTKNKLTQLFKNAKLPVSFSGFKKINVLNYTGVYAQSILDLSSPSIVKPKEIVDWLRFDKKSSMSIVTIKNKTFSTVDYYIEDNSIIEFASISNNSKLGNQIDDEELFAEVLPNSLENYHFIETNFNSQLDKKFSKSPMYQWIEYGFVTFQYEGETILISDYKTEQNPILVLNDYTNNTENFDEEMGFFKNIQLTKEFPSDISKGFYIKTMDDFVVMSTSENACEKVIADYKLGNTIALKKENLSLIFDDLPKKVSERTIFKTYKTSKSKYRSKVITTKVNIDPNVKSTKKESNNLSIHIGQDVQDIMVFEGVGNLIALTKSGSLIGFNKGEETWKKELVGYPFGSIQKIQYNSDDKFLVSTSKELYIFDENGNLENGFPIKFEKNTTNPATHFSYKGSNLFTVANENNEICTYNSKGKIISKLNTKLTKIAKPISIWTSNKITLFGTSDEFNFTIFNFDKKKELRSFPIPTNTVSIVSNNEIQIFGVEQNDLIKCDQKGNKTMITKTSEGKILKVVNEKTEPFILVQSQNELLKLNVSSNKLLKQTLKFGQIDDVFINTSDLVTALVDGIGNNIYIFKNNIQLNEKALEGKEIVKLSYSKNEIIVTTLMDEYIVQYTQY